MGFELRYANSKHYAVLNQATASLWLPSLFHHTVKPLAWAFHCSSQGRDAALASYLIVMQCMGSHKKLNWDRAGKCSLTHCASLCALFSTLGARVSGLVPILACLIAEHSFIHLSYHCRHGLWAPAQSKYRDEPGIHIMTVWNVTETQLTQAWERRCSRK